MMIALLALCEGNPPVTGGFLSQRPVAQSFDVFFDLRLNSRRWWFEMPPSLLWRHCNVKPLLNLQVLKRAWQVAMIAVLQSWAASQYNDRLSRYRESHYRCDGRASFHNGHPYTWWDDIIILRRPGMLSSLCYSFEDLAPVDEISLRVIFKSVAVTWPKDRAQW